MMSNSVRIHSRALVKVLSTTSRKYTPFVGIKLICHLVSSHSGHRSYVSIFFVLQTHANYDLIEQTIWVAMNTP